jgi:hypothetical protein
LAFNVCYFITPGINPKDGNKYILKLNNKQYSIDFSFNNNMKAYVSGNTALVGLKPNNCTDPYFLAFLDGMLIIATPKPGKYKVSLVAESIPKIETVHKIDSKYIAEGKDTDPSGYMAHAEGIRTTASGEASHAENMETIASGDYSHAEGYNSEASGDYSHAEGYNSEASGDNAHAQGANTVSSGEASHSEGIGTQASGNGAHAEGDSTIASGGNSHAEGYTTYATGDSSHSEGSNTRATNLGAHSEGINTQATGEAAHAEGADSIAQGGNSHAEGNGTKAAGVATHTEGVLTEATGDAAHAEGASSKASGAYSHAEGYASVASGVQTHAEGDSTVADGHGAHSEGVSTQAIGDASHTEGLNTVARGRHQHVQGRYNIEDTENKYAHIVGNGDAALPSNAHTLDWEGNAWFNGEIIAKKFYIEEEILKTTTIMPETELKYQYTNNRYVNNANNFNVLKRYRVVADRRVYNNLVCCVYNQTTLYIGNGYLYNTSLPNTGEPFCFLKFSSSLYDIYVYREYCYNENHTYSLEVIDEFRKGERYEVGSKTNESTGRTAQTYVILTDIENGYDYAIQMKGGNLVSKSLPDKVEVTTPPTKTTYYRGDFFDPTGIVLTATHYDGYTEIIEDFESSHMEESFDSLGAAEVTIKAKTPADFDLTLVVDVVEFNPAEVLIDFNYSANADGTYTITGWKGTLNGEQSTELIIPNNSLIKL